MDNMRTCQVEGCELPLVVKGFCRGHYDMFKGFKQRGTPKTVEQFLKHATNPRTHKPKSRKPCLVDGCENPYVARGMCKRHHENFLSFIKRGTKETPKTMEQFLEHAANMPTTTKKKTKTTSLLAKHLINMCMLLRKKQGVINMETMQVASFKLKEIYHGLKLPIICVYHNPSDFPDKYVGRLFDVDVPTSFAVVKDSLEELRDEIPETMVQLERSPEDDPVIVETWL